MLTPVLCIIKMRVFVEEQRFNQWWLYAIFAFTFAGWFLIIHEKIQKGKSFDELIIFIFFGILLILIILGFFSLRLETRIDAKGITARFTPFRFLTRHYEWKEIREIFVREYSPIAEYGGWGIRGLGKKKAYNVAGNNGIQIVTKDKKNFLIGTQQPEVAKRVINYYREKQLHSNY